MFRDQGTTLHYMPDDVRVPAHGLYLRVMERLALTGMTKTELRKRTGVARSTIDSWATQATPPQARTVNKVADALGINRVEALQLAGILDDTAAPAPQLVPLDEFERRVVASDLPADEQAAAIRRHREQAAHMLAELGISDVPEALRRTVRRYAGATEPGDAEHRRGA